MNDLITTETRETTPLTLIEMAMSKPDFDIEKLERLMAMQERWQAEKKKEAFFNALSDFQMNCPAIKKNKATDFTTKSGMSVKYKYATLDEITTQIKQALYDAGLTYRWEFSEATTLNEATKLTVKSITCTCIITHKEGHREVTILSANADTSGLKNDIQSLGSTQTYLQRYSLIGALGISTAEEDVDGSKKTDGQLNPELQNLVNLCKNEDDLKTLWEMNQDMHKDNSFIRSVNNKKTALKNGK